ncbi:hypothetical protein M422DRAFT_261051 [Sphaerobolus stellatus SS14]|uniref:Uncharacterized protein n=1 Tax=Sphaerobolus stellatus (strain SS14) TaxID=990650 RepID=A0A0C9UNW1_SPHS4|nr:hypothetical protein M422DRAFT_261051 [Sphaerobolus stellatus SS14]
MEGNNWADIKTAGHLWTNHPNLKILEKSLLRRYVEQGDLYIFWDGEMVLNAVVTTKLLRQIGEINCQICMLVYFLPGRNRLTEHFDHKFINDTCPRMVFHHDKDIWFAIQ